MTEKNIDNKNQKDHEKIIQDLERRMKKDETKKSIEPEDSGKKTLRYGILFFSVLMASAITAFVLYLLTSPDQAKEVISPKQNSENDSMPPLFKEGRDLDQEQRIPDDEDAEGDGSENESEQEVEQGESQEESETEDDTPSDSVSDADDSQSQKPQLDSDVNSSGGGSSTESDAEARERNSAPGEENETEEDEEPAGNVAD